MIYSRLHNCVSLLLLDIRLHSTLIQRPERSRPLDDRKLVGTMDRRRPTMFDL